MHYCVNIDVFALMFALIFPNQNFKSFYITNNFQVLPIALFIFKE